VLGGIGNVHGAMLGGLILGLAEQLVSSYVSSQWKDAIAFGILILILLVKPSGCSGRAPRRRCRWPGSWGQRAAAHRAAVRSWLPFFAAVPVLVLIQEYIALNPDFGLEYAFQNINHIGIAIILAVSLNLRERAHRPVLHRHAGFHGRGRLRQLGVGHAGPQEDPYRIFRTRGPRRRGRRRGCRIPGGKALAAPARRLLAIVTLGFGEIIR